MSSFIINSVPATLTTALINELTTAPNPLQLTDKLEIQQTGNLTNTVFTTLGDIQTLIGSGNVTSSVSSVVDGQIVIFDGTTGQVIKNNSTFTFLGQTLLSSGGLNVETSGGSFSINQANPTRPLDVYSNITARKLLYIYNPSATGWVELEYNGLGNTDFNYPLVNPTAPTANIAQYLKATGSNGDTAWENMPVYSETSLPNTFVGAIPATSSTINAVLNGKYATVSFDGVLSQAITVDAIIVSTAALPVNFRPLTSETFLKSVTFNSKETLCMVQIATNGIISIHLAQTSVADTLLDGNFTIGSGNTIGWFNITIGPYRVA